MRDWLSWDALYVPSWILAGTILALWGITQVSALAAIIWLAIGFAIALLAWRASAHQVRDGREIRENIGKLVSVTEPSPKNILAAAAAKILTLEHSQTELKGELDEWKGRDWRRLREDEKASLTGKLKLLGKHSIRILSNRHVAPSELAGDLYRAFESAGWVVNLFELLPKTVETLDLDDQKRVSASGIQVFGKYGDETEVGVHVTEALQPIVKGGLMFAASLGPDEVADVVLVVGSKSARSMLP